MTDSTNEQPSPFDLNSDDVAARKRADLMRLFPEVFNEDKIDFDQLRRVMGDWADESTERFGLTWPGKAACTKVIQAPATGALHPQHDGSVNFGKSENVFIEGDNLEVLKLLQKAYFGKIKLIYIDPPYNTGNEFIYPDRFAENLDTYLSYTGQVDAEGRQFSTNSDRSGRFHSRWLNMMYPRLILARNLMREDGVIFISIDDNEIHNLRAICNQIFGEECFLGVISRVTGTPTGGGNTALVGEVDYLLAFGRTPNIPIVGAEFSEEDASIYDKEDKNGRYLTRMLRRTGGEDRREDRPSMYYGVTAPDGTEIFPIAPEGYESRWRCGKERFEEMSKTGLIEWSKIKKDGKEIWQVYQKFYLEGRTKQPSNFWSKLEGNKKASRDLRSLFDGERVFTFPNPHYS